ncbi:hypothetical protein GGS23DRAFT_576734 [Durotheca rogersii]|uniref:uncharacterized protein n=1 Tax=Durotheca rogersii TaxID=419775 RepID=UPI00221E943C|nr:uncharacterized protein GGS23DRAFT_576734 [Durotheca rogersii]KAI5861417.1 hypothetical protein GGS23DRAFT_576734 [Durotheca rogersii]
MLSRLNLTLSEGYLLGSMDYPNRDPDRHRGGEYVGNEHAEIEETYLDRVMIIVPKEFALVPLIGDTYSHEDLNAVMVRLRDTIGADAHSKGHDTDTSMRKLILQLCDNVLNKKPDKRRTSEQDFRRGHVAVTAAIFGDAPLFHKAVVQTHGAWAGASCFALGVTMDFQEPSVDEKDLITALTKGDTLEICRRSIVQFHRGFCEANRGREDQAKAEHAQQWYTDRLVEVLRNISDVVDKDYSALLGIILEDQVRHTPQQREVLDEAAVCFLHGFGHHGGIVNGLTIKVLIELQNLGNVRSMFLHSVLHILLEPAISTFDLERYYNRLQLDYPYGCRIFQDGEKEGKRETRISNAGPIRSFYDWAAAYSEDAASRLLWKLQMQASRATKATVQGILPPLMAELMPSVNTDSVEVQRCFQSLVKIYITKTVGEEPSKPRDWARPAEVISKCRRSNDLPCDKCREINDFLQDPMAQKHTMDLQFDRLHLIPSFHQFMFFRVEEVAQGHRTCLTKTLGWWERRHQDWEQAAGMATKALQDLPQDKLQELLADQYGTLMALDPVRTESAKLPKRRPDENESTTEPGVLPKRIRCGEESTGDCKGDWTRLRRDPRPN